MNADVSQIMLGVLGIFGIGRGLVVLLTGKLGERETARLRNFSETGVRRYKLLSAFSNIVGGAIVVVASAISMFTQVDRNLYRIVLLAILAVMVVAYVLIWNSCKNAK